MLKKKLSGRCAARQFKETITEPPTQLKESRYNEKDALFAEMEKALESLRQAINLGEATADKIAAALSSGDDNGK